MLSCNKKIRIHAKVLLFIASVLALSLFSYSESTHAYSPAEITKKAVMQGLIKCYNGNAFKSEFSSAGAYSGLNSLYANNGGYGEGDLPLPSSMNNKYHKISDNTVGCEDIIKGYNGWGGSIDSAFKLMGHAAPASGASNVGTWLETYGGYKKEEGSTGSGGGKCVKFNFRKTVTTATNAGPKTDVTDVSTDQICIDKIENGVIKQQPTIVADGGYNGHMTGYGSEYAKAFRIDTSTGDLQIASGIKNEGYGYSSNVYTTFTSVDKKWDNFVSEIVSFFPTSTVWVYDLGNLGTGCRSVPCKTGEKVEYVSKAETGGGDADTVTASYKIDSNSGKKAVAYLYGLTQAEDDGGTVRASYHQKRLVTQQERVHLYMYYFSTYQGNTISCGISEDTAQGNGYEGPIKWFTNGSTTVSTDCYVTKKGPRASNKVNGVDSTGIFYLENISYDDLFNFFKTLSITELDDASGEEDTPLPEDPGDPSEPEETEPTCASRAGELGWILCPLIKGAGELLQGFFEDWIEPFLQIDAELLSGTNNGVFEAWQGFQTIANLIFVVIFLFVIFSQLTGVGIDNYGIKKVLPKLIIGAVLINLSYIICQLAVDLSNILGSAMKSFFGSMPPSVAGVEIRVNGGAGTGWFEAGAVALTVIVGALVVQKVLTMGIMVIIPILILLLTVLFSLFFLFFMLGVRQALAIVLVTVSPLAFVCYILPNTKSLFKKWVDLFKAMLLAYPIASAMVWGGDLVSRILINANAAAGTSGVVESLGLLVTAAVVSIAPVFAIPGLLKKSLSAIDGVGGMLSKVQSGGRRGLDATEKGMRDSRVGTRMQTWQDSRNKKRDENRNLRRAGLRRNANGEIELSDRGRAQNRRAEKLGNGTTGRAYRQRLADARNAAFSNYNADMSANRVATGTGALATLAGLSAKQDRQAIEDEIINMAKGENANPLLAGTGNYDPNLMEDQLLGLMRKGDRTSEEKLRMKALVSKMSETGDGNKRIASILSGKKGAVDAGARKELASYITSNDVASKIGGKDMYVAQYMRDIEAGYYSADTSFDDWAVSASSMGNGVSNVEFVSKKILDDDDLLAKQSTDSLKRTIEVDQAHNGAAGTGTYTASDGSQHAITVGIADAEALSSGRAQKLVESDNIHTKEEQDTILTNRQNGNPVSRPAPQVQPGQQPVTPTVRTRLNPTQQQQQQNNP